MSDGKGDKPILLFDGVCNLCNGVVQFTIKHDPQGKFRFASLQSEAGQVLLKSFNLPTQEFESFVLIEDGRAYTRSTAALRVMHGFAGWWRLLYVFILVPSFIRDAVYQFIASNRYRWFGRQDQCWLPTPDLKARFLETEGDLQ